MSRTSVALVASGGGHLDELLRLQGAWQGQTHFFVTTGSTAASELVKRSSARIYVLAEANRRHPIRMLRLLWTATQIFLRERPTAVLSTGAAPGCLLCLLARLARRRVVWVDSIANVERPSLSGRIVRYVADLFLVQWPELARRYPKARYVGELV